MPTQQELLAAHWEAKHALEYWKQKETAAKLALADCLCEENENIGYSNKTLTLGDGTKLKLAVKRDLKVDDRDKQAVKAINQCIADKQLTAPQLDAFMKQQTRYSLAGYNSLPNVVKEALENFVSETESVSISYVKPTEDR